MIQLYIGFTYKIGKILAWEKDTKSSTECDRHNKLLGGLYDVKRQLPLALWSAPLIIYKIYVFKE